MSERNVEVVRRWIELYNRRDLDGLVELSAPDLEFRSLFAGLEAGGIFRGYRGLGDYFASLAEAYEHFEFVAPGFLDAGAAVVISAAIRWRGRGSGATANTPIFPVAWLRAGKVFRIETFLERRDALQAVGLDA